MPPIDWTVPLVTFVPSLVVIFTILWGVRQVHTGRKALFEENREWHEAREGREVHRALAEEHVRELYSSLFAEAIAHFIGSDEFRMKITTLVEARVTNEREFVSMKLEGIQKDMQLQLIQVGQQIGAKLDDQRRDLDARLNTLDRRLLHTAAQARKKKRKADGSSST